MQRSLGINISQENPVITQQNQWIDKEKHTLNILKTNKMSYTEAEILYKTTYNPQIQYLLPFFSVPKKKYNKSPKAQWLSSYNTQVLKQNPERCCLWRKSMGGLGWNDMAIEQGLQNIARLIIGMHDKEILGITTNTMLNQWKWLIGFDAFQQYKLQTPHDESIWLKNIRKSMVDYGIQIKKTIQAYPILREKDEYLMQRAVQLQLDTNEIRYISYCRLYLNVITILDITEPDGIHMSGNLSPG
jgi:hypothetical protein